MNVVKVRLDGIRGNSGELELTREFLPHPLRLHGVRGELTTTRTTRHGECYSGVLNKTLTFRIAFLMACSVSHTYDEIKAMVDKQIEEDKARQLVIMNLAVEYDNACEAKDDLQNAYEECNDISLETRTLIETFLKQGSNKDYEMHNSLFRKAAKIEK
ncbi:hypothetical protein Tco_1116153 [Tanacetum coccineum]